MKKLILAAASLIAFSINAQEVEKPAPSKHAQEKREKLTIEQRAQKSVDQINLVAMLTEDQKIKMYDLALLRAKSVDEIRIKYKEDKTQLETAKKEIQVVKKSYRQNAKALLTQEQIEKIKLNHNENKAKNKSAEDALESKD